ncbi:hypothetical protein DC31_15485 [Microbacterium sp. CH12i]|nr:hypothetical protein DC31_15485 [Microbacterium sp. CH12i]
MLTGPPLPEPAEQVDRRRLRAKSYSDESPLLLEHVGVDGLPCGKYFVVMLPIWLPLLRGAGDLYKPFATSETIGELEAMSPATIDRYAAAGHLDHEAVAVAAQLDRTGSNNAISPRPAPAPTTRAIRRSICGYQNPVYSLHNVNDECLVSQTLVERNRDLQLANHPPSRRRHRGIRILDIVPEPILGTAGHEVEGPLDDRGCYRRRLQLDDVLVWRPDLGRGVEHGDVSTRQITEPLHQ